MASLPLPFDRLDERGVRGSLGRSGFCIADEDDGSHLAVNERSRRGLLLLSRICDRLVNGSLEQGPRL